MPQPGSGIHVKTLLEQAMQAARQGDHTSAKGLFQMVLDQDPDQEEAWLWLAALVEDTEQSVLYLQRVLADNPHNTRAQAGLQWARKRIPSAETFLKAPARPEWGGIVHLVPLEPERTRWQWWHAASLAGILLLVGGLSWWGTSKLLQVVEPSKPEITVTEPVPTDTLPATGVPPSPTVAVIVMGTPSPTLPTATVLPTATSSSVPTIVTATLTATPSSVPTSATVWPTPGPTTQPLITLEPTSPSSR